MDTDMEFLDMLESGRPSTFSFDKYKMDTNMKFPNMLESGRPSTFPFDRYMRDERKKLKEQHDAVKQPMSELHCGYNANEHTKKSNSVDHRLFSRLKDNVRASEELKMPHMFDWMPSVFTSPSTNFSERRMEQDNLRVLNKSSMPNMFDRALGVFRSPPQTPRTRRQEQSTLPIISVTRFLTLREIIVKNWILVKDNSSPFSWWKQFREMDFLPISEFRDLDNKTTNIERRDLAELLLIKTLQKDVCTSMEQIEVLKTIILKGIENDLIHKKREHAQIESDDKKLYDCFKKNKKEWEKCLNRRDVIQIKDHLLQEDFITFEDNEELVNDDNYYKRSKEHLFSQIVQKVDEGIGSFQCFIRHAETIIRQKQSGQKLLQKITRQPRSRMQPAKRSASITKKEESFAVSDKHKGQQYNLSIKMKDEKGKEETGVYRYVEKNADAINVVLAKTSGATCDKISLGSIVIHFHPLDRDTRCTFEGHFVKLIHMLLQEVILKSKIPSGKYTLIAEVNATQYVNRTVSEFKPLTDEINFVTAEKSFLVEEIDIDAVFGGFKMRNITIESMNQTGCRKDRARDLLNAITKNSLEDDFINILREYKMTYILNRYETYMNVYKSETAILRRNIINKFSSIIECIDIDDVREVLLDRGVTKESTLNELVFKFENRRDVAMATLMIEFLKSGNAIHAFAYALFLQEYNPLLVYNSPQESKGISDADKENEIGTYPVEHSRPMYSGCFNITIGAEERTVQEYTTNGTKECKQTTKRMNRTVPNFRDVRYGALFCHKGKRLAFPVSASNIGFPYQQSDARTNHGMIHPLNNRFNYAFTGFRALSLSTRPYNEYQHDLLCRLSNAGSSNRARTTTPNRPYKEYQREVSCQLLNAGSPNRARTTTKIDVAECDYDIRILSNNDELSEIAMSPVSTTYTTDSGDSTRLEADGNIHRIRSPASTLGTKGSGDSKQIEADSYIHRIRSPESTIGSQDSGDSTQLEADGYTHRIRSPVSTLGTKDSGDSTQLEADSYIHRIRSLASPLGTTDSGDSTQLQADGYTHRIRSPVSTLGTTDSGYSTQLEADSYIHRIRSPASTTGTTDSGYSTQLEADGYIHRIRSSVSTLGTTDSGDSTQLEADSYIHRIRSPVSTLGTKDSGDSKQLEADGYIDRIRSLASTLGTTDSGDSTQLEADVYKNRVRSPASTLGIKDPGYSTQLEADVYTSRVRTPDV